MTWCFLVSYILTRWTVNSLENRHKLGPGWTDDGRETPLVLHRWPDLVLCLHDALQLDDACHPDLCFLVKRPARLAARHPDVWKGFLNVFDAPQFLLSSLGRFSSSDLPLS